MVGFKIHPACIFKKNSRHHIGNVKYHRLQFHRLPITSLHMTTSSTPPPDKSSLLTINFDSNFVMSLSLAIFFFVILFLFGQTIQLQTKSDVIEITEKIISRVDVKFDQMSVEFKGLTKKVDELKDFKLQATAIIAFVAFVGTKPLIDFVNEKSGAQNTIITTNTNTDKPKRK